MSASAAGNGNVLPVTATSEAAAVVRGYHCVAVIGEDGDAAAAVARSIGSEIARDRKVVLADMVGDVPMLRDLSAEPDPEGIEDSFEYGISLGRMSHPTPVENFFLIPSGSDAVAREEIFHSGRWTRLARQSRASGSLLLVVARSTAPGVRALVEQLDGAVVVGSASPPGMRVLHRVEAADVRRALGKKGAPRLAGGVIVGVALLAIAAFAAWQATKGPDAPAEPSSAATPAVVRDTAARATLLPVNPADSLLAAGFAVEIMSANTRDGANFELRRNRERFPAATLTPVAVGEARATWYKVMVGAYPDLRTADSLLRTARERGIVGDSAGLVLRAPLALLVDSAASGAEVQQAVERHTARGLPAYALRQRDGRALVYVGAFARPEEADLFAAELTAAGMRPVLVYRTGRVF
ncbi:MAG TPA: SPOR domain-containing protein [Gemmatimonadaceae bacterium]